MRGGCFPIPTPPKAGAAHNLPPHLREVCAILAVGIIRLRAARLAHTSPQTLGTSGDSSLHFRPHQSGHATRTNRRNA